MRHKSIPEPLRQIVNSALPDEREIALEILYFLRHKVSAISYDVKMENYSSAAALCEQIASEFLRVSDRLRKI